MSALGQKQTCAVQPGMSALPPKADMCGATRDVRYRPIADISWASSFEPLRREQEVVESLGSRRHTLGLRAKNIGVGGQHFDIHCFVDALDDSRSHH
jgi:hypothetical protein